MELQVTEAENAMYISRRNKTKRQAGRNPTEIWCCRSYFFIVNYFFSAYSGKKKTLTAHTAVVIWQVQFFVFPLAALSSHQGSLKGSWIVRSRIHLKFGEGQVPWRGAGDTLWQQFHSKAPLAVQLKHQRQGRNIWDTEK